MLVGGGLFTVGLRVAFLQKAPTLASKTKNPITGKSKELLRATIHGDSTVPVVILCISWYAGGMLIEI